MTIYGYQCRTCGQDYESTVRADRLVESCQVCLQPVTRKYSIRVERTMQEHWNVSTNSAISSDRQFRDELNRKSDAEFMRTGIPCQYEPVDPELIHAHVVAKNGVGLESTNRARVAEGRKPIRL